MKYRYLWAGQQPAHHCWLTAPGVRLNCWSLGALGEWMVWDSLLAEEVSRWNHPWRLRGKISDFQGSYVSHKGGRKLLAREQLSGKEKKEHKFCCYCWLAPAFCQSLESCTDPLSRKSFLWHSWGQALRARTKPGLFDVQLREILRNSVLAWEGKHLTGVLPLYECALLLHMGTHVTQPGLGRRTYKYIDLQEQSRQPSWTFCKESRMGFVFHANFFWLHSFLGSTVNSSALFYVYTAASWKQGKGGESWARQQPCTGSVALLHSQHHCQLGKLLWKLTGLFT